MNENPKVLGIIPARYGSTRFPGKPLVKILDKTLIQRTYENAKTCEAFDEIVVATDDQRIFDHVEEFGGKVVMTSANCLTGTDRLAEVIRNNRKYDDTQLIVNVQGDEPCINVSAIEKAVHSLINESKAVISTAVVPLDPQNADDANAPKCVIDCNGYALYFSRALIPGNRTGCYDKNLTYYKHVGLYVYKRDFLLKYGELSPTPLQLAEDLEQLKVLEHGYSIKVVVVDYLGLDVNVPDDIKKVEKELCKVNTSL